MTLPRPFRPWLIGAGVGLLIGAVVAGVAVQTSAVRASVRTYTALIAAANRQDVAAARALCTAKFRAKNSLGPAAEGGLVGLPRGIHPNFQAWRQDEYVWICPRNRVGPVYQFAWEAGDWRFDGLVGLLRGGGELIRLPEGTTADDPLAIPEG